MPCHPRSTDQIRWAGQNVNNTAFLSDRLGVIVETIEGLLERPPVRVENRVRAGRHGARRGARKQAARPLTLSGIVFGTSYADVESRKDALAALFIPDERDEEGGLLEFVHPVHGAQQLTARVEQEFTWGDPFECGSTWPEVGIAWTVGLTAHDPRRYATALTSAQSSTIATGGGFSAPLTSPLTVIGVGSGGTADVPAGGNFERPATLTIHGPVTNPIVEDISSGTGLAIAFDGITISTGDYVVIDTDEHTALMFYGSAPGSLNVYGYLDFDATRIVNLPPDATSLRLRGSNITDPAKLVVTTRAAYL